MSTIQFNPEKVAQYLLDNKFDDLLTIQFLQKAVKKDLILHEIDQYKMTYKVSIHPNDKTFEFPAVLFLDSGVVEEDHQPEEEEEQTITKPIFQHMKDNKLLIGVSILLLVIIAKDFLPSNANSLTTDKVMQSEINVKNDFQILTDKANQNRELISQELQEQKTLRDQKRKIDENINDSIQRVKNLESENNTIRNNLLQLSQ